MGENYDYIERLRGRTFWRSSWARRSAHWDHDHCAVCWTKISDDSDPNSIHAGFATGPDDTHGARYEWVCEPCFAKAAEQMGWSVGSARVVGFRPR